jgi:hypothetical protein
VKLFEDEDGLSVVVGTQKKEMDQRSLRAAVESENLKILSLALSGSDNGSWKGIQFPDPIPHTGSKQ